MKFPEKKWEKRKRGKNVYVILSQIKKEVSGFFFSFIGLTSLFLSFFVFFNYIYYVKNEEKEGGKIFNSKKKLQIKKRKAFSSEPFFFTSFFLSFLVLYFLVVHLTLTY